MKRMRTVYREQMDNLAHSLIVMCDRVGTMHKLANKALFEADLVSAETVLSQIDSLEDLRRDAEQRAFELLAREAPVAGDLRQIVSGLYIVEDISRMGALSVHIANVARRRHPNKALPEPVEGFFREMASVSEQMTHETRQVLIDYDVDQALALDKIDDSIDDIHQHLFTLTNDDNWPHSPAQTVDVTLLSRFYERYADHAVEVAARIIYLATGYKRDVYLDKLEDERDQRSFNQRLQALERHLRM